MYSTLTTVSRLVPALRLPDLLAYRQSCSNPAQREWVQHRIVGFYGLSSNNRTGLDPAALVFLLRLLVTAADSRNYSCVIFCYPVYLCISCLLLLPLLLHATGTRTR